MTGYWLRVNHLKNYRPLSSIRAKKIPDMKVLKRQSVLFM